MWPLDSSSSSSSNSTSDSKGSLSLTTLTSSSPTELLHLLLETPYLSGPLLAGSLLGSYFGYRRFLRRIPNADFVTPRMLADPGGKGRGRVIRGVVTSVGDADNFRLYHTPGPGWKWLRKVPTGRTELKDQTIHVRIAGVDAPELPHFGQPGQPYGPEALDHLKSLVENKKVKVRLISKDRYSRIVGMAYVRRFWFVPWRRRNVSLAMAEAGLATVYRSAGAEYGGMLKKFEKAEARAKRYGIGMWAQGKGAYVSPGEYKNKHPGPS